MDASHSTSDPAPPMDYDFSQMRDPLARTALESGYRCAVHHDLIDFFKNVPPPESTGYIFWTAPELKILSEWYDGHNISLSGAMFALACRLLQAFLKDPEGTLFLYRYK